MKNDDIFGGFFDFNGDGKTDISKKFIAYKIFEEIEKEENPIDCFDVENSP